MVSKRQCNKQNGDLVGSRGIFLFQETPLFSRSFFFRGLISIWFLLKFNSNQFANYKSRGIINGHIDLGNSFLKFVEHVSFMV